MNKLEGRAACWSVLGNQKIGVGEAFKRQAGARS